MEVDTHIVTHTLTQIETEQTCVQHALIFNTSFAADKLEI